MEIRINVSDYLSGEETEIMILEETRKLMKIININIMKRLIDKLCACWCILSSREYVIFTCNKLDKA